MRKVTCSGSAIARCTAAVTSVLLAGIAFGSPTPRLGLRPGEAFTYRFSVGPIEGARARMSVGLPAQQGGRSLIAVQGQAETISLVSLVAPVHASYQLVIDAATLLPREVTTAERGLRERKFHSVLDGRALDLEVVSPTRSNRMKRTLPREARDPLSAYFALRAAALTAGEELDLDVLDGAALWRARLKVAGREDVRLNQESPTPSPPLHAIRIEGRLERIDDAGRSLGRPARTITCWLSDDAARALLKASFDSDLGRASLELTSYLPPAHVAQRPARPAAGEPRAAEQATD